jgi:hypothetical protein
LACSILLQEGRAGHEDSQGGAAGERRGNTIGGVLLDGWLSLKCFSAAEKESVVNFQNLLQPFIQHGQMQ